MTRATQNNLLYWAFLISGVGLLWSYKTLKELEG